MVSHTTDSFTFASQHHFFPGWVRVVSAHTRDRVRGIPCDHDAEEERRVKQRVRRDVEPPEVRRFLLQELLTKVGHSWWNRPRVYRYDRDDEREPMQSLRSVVVVPQGQEQQEEARHQQELSPAVPGDRMTLVRPVASPVTSLPHTPGRDIVVIGSSEESPRTREGRLAAATLEQEMGRRSVAEAIRPIRDASRRRRSPETTERRHEAGPSGCSFPLLSLPVRDASRRRRSPETTERRHARDVAFPSSRSQLGMRAGDDGRLRRRSDGTLGM